jgi:NAD(P)-dependent dehydrogenase (short-subunit alcohol dehydrogenase family)
MPTAKPRKTATPRRRRTTAGSRLLQGKNAIVYGGGGGIGAGVSRAFAREGATVFLAGRNREPLEAVAASIRTVGGTAEVAEVDVTDERAVDEHAGAVAAKGGSIDVAATVISYGDVPGTPLLEIDPADFARPVATAMTANFLTARAAARQMAKQGSGAILTISNGAATSVAPAMGSTGVIAAAIETFTRYLACEVGPLGVRALGLRIAAVPETWVPGEQTRADFDNVLGESPDRDASADDLAAIVAELAQTTMLRRLSTLDEVANVAVFLASSQASAMTGTVTNVTCGLVPD